MTRALSALIGFALWNSACAGARAGEADGSVMGRYTWGAEVNTFRPCGADVEYWVTGTTSTVQALRGRYEAFQLPPYAAAFVEARGEVGPVLDCGFCESYDGSFRIEELLRMESPVPASCAN